MPINKNSFRKWSKTRWILLGAAAICILCVIAVPIFSSLMHGDYPGHAVNSHRTRSRSKGDPALEGSWAAPFNIGIIPIHMVLLKNDTVLMWQYANKQNTGGILVSLYDVASGTVTPLNPPDRYWDYFCAGESQLADGRLLIDGGLGGPQGQGSPGIFQTTIFDPSTNSWERSPAMHYARYYPSNLQLANGKTLIFAGLDQTGYTMVSQIEEYDPSKNGFTVLPASADLPNPQGWDTYPRVFLLTNGIIFIAGQTQDTWFFNPFTYTWTFAGKMNYPDRHEEGAVLMPDLHTVFVTGGYYSEPNSKQPATSSTEFYDTSLRSAKWIPGPAMNIARHDHNLIEMPDGTLIAIGGASSAMKYGDPVYTPELFDPKTSTWTELAPQLGARGYHSTAILLPDGTILSAGSDSGDSLETYGEIFSPPYLFKGARPTVSSAPSSLTYAGNFTIQTPDASDITSVVLIRDDSLTHSDHFDQREVPLNFTAGDGQLSVTAPPNGNYAPPGYYMLFIVNSEGVPAVAPIVNLD